jgi:hypothetical protein
VKKLGKVLRHTLRSHENPKHLHGAFRFPARLHHRVSSTLIQAYSRPGSTICDPFVGCGTNQLEAAIHGRNSLGYDVDPLSVFITKAKLGALHFSESELRRYGNLLLGKIENCRRGRDYESLMFADISRLNGAAKRAALSAASTDLIKRWFRRYVIQDLAIILETIRATRAPAELKHLALLSFASILRSCSNADPVPVSGLEYTKRMRERDLEGRRIDPFSLYEKRLARTIFQAIEFLQSSNSVSNHATFNHDITRHWPSDERYDLLMFSPPYLSAVEYSRRHKLEMAWLSLIDTHADFLTLSRKYIGHRITGKEPVEIEPFGDPYIDRIRKSLLHIDYRRARAFIRYCHQMHAFFGHAALHMHKKAKLVTVIGDNTVAGIRILSDRVMSAVAEPLTLSEQHTYPLRNRYMTYTRHNGADICAERILVFSR